MLTWLLGDDRRLHRGEAQRSMDLGWLAQTHCGVRALRGIRTDAEVELLSRSMERCGECARAQAAGEPLRRPRPGRREPVVHALDDVDYDF